MRLCRCSSLHQRTNSAAQSRVLAVLSQRVAAGPGEVSIVAMYAVKVMKQSKWSNHNHL